MALKPPKNTGDLGPWPTADKKGALSISRLRPAGYTRVLLVYKGEKGIVLLGTTYSGLHMLTKQNIPRRTYTHTHTPLFHCSAPHRALNRGYAFIRDIGFGVTYGFGT